MSAAAHIDPSNKKIALLLAWIAGGLGVVGLIFVGIGFLAPTVVHLF